MNSRKIEHTPWETITQRKIFEARPWVKLSVLQVRLPDGKVIDDYYQVKLQDYAGVFAQTADGRVILERQYKHGVGRPSLVLPGGTIEAGEDPLLTAQRELLEETGYIADDWQPLGNFVGDANQVGSMAHLFLAGSARQVAQPHSGDLEEIEIVLLTPEEIVQVIRQGEVAVLGTIAAIALALNPMFNHHIETIYKRVDI